MPESGGTFTGYRYIDAVDVNSWKYLKRGYMNLVYIVTEQQKLVKKLNKYP
jgi:hypothetical protein